MNWRRVPNSKWRAATAALLVLAWAAGADAGATIPGETGTNFSFSVKQDFISGGDGHTIHIWGFALNGGRAQYPGPTLILGQGANITITLTNELSGSGAENVSMIFPGMSNVQATGGVAGAITQEAEPGGTAVTYTFDAANPGTYMYQSGTRMDLQVEMGLIGAIIVRPTGFDPGNPTAYGDVNSAYEHEFLFLLSEMDWDIHRLMEFNLHGEVDTTLRRPVYWFINGRNGPDTIMDAGLPWLPTQPYNCAPRTHPGERLLLRLIGGGRNGHPFHTHGNNIIVIAQDGVLLETSPGASAGEDYPNLGYSDYTLAVVPGQTYDAVFTWTGEGLGWDIYGHEAGDAMETDEYAPDHGKPFPVVFPEQIEFVPGAFYSGSPFLGVMGDIPPGEGGYNSNAGFAFMWHSHNEFELVNNDVFPGGMLTLLIIEPHGVPIP